MDGEGMSCGEDATTGRTPLKIASKPPQAGGEAWTNFPSRPQEEPAPRTPDRRLLASRAIRHPSAVESS